MILRPPDFKWQFARSTCATKDSPSPLEPLDTALGRLHEEQALLRADAIAGKAEGLLGRMDTMDRTHQVGSLAARTKHFRVHH